MNTIDIEQVERDAERFAALSEPTRLALFEIIAYADGTLNVLGLRTRMREVGYDLAQPTISHHLNILKRAKLIVKTKRGQETFYVVQPEPLKELRRFLAVMAEERLFVYAPAIA